MKSVEQSRKEIAQLIRDYANQLINIVVSAQCPKQPLTSEGQANRILSILFDQTRDDCFGCEGTGRAIYSGIPKNYEGECIICNGTGKDLNSEWHPELLQDVRKVISFVESYLVTTAHTESKMHHIDDKEWQTVKNKLLQTTSKR